MLMRRPGIARDEDGKEEVGRRVTLMTYPGPHHFGINSIRKGRTPCSQTRGKGAESREERGSLAGESAVRGVP